MDTQAVTIRCTTYDFATPLLSFLVQSILLLTTLGSAAVRLLYIFPPSFEAIAPLVVLANALGGAPPVLADAFTMDHLKDKTDYGKQRLWGAVGWGLGAPLSGMVVSSTGIESAFYLHAACKLLFSALVLKSSLVSDDFVEIGRKGIQLALSLSILDVVAFYMFTTISRTFSTIDFRVVKSLTRF